jgi:hypothetical protein
VRSQHTLVEKHGKNVCDGASNIPKHIFESAVKDHAEIPPGPREAVVFMAKSHPAPTVAKSKKSEWWAFNRLFYGYYEHDLFTNEHIPEATGFAGSSKCHQFVGLSSDRGILDGKVPILARDDFFYCRSATAEPADCTTTPGASTSATGPCADTRPKSRA